MKKFDKQITQNKKQHIRLLLASGAILLLITLMVLLGLFSFHGYTVNVHPQQANQTHSFSIEKGIGIFIDNKLYTLTDSFQFITEAKKFIPHKTIISNRSEQNINIVLKPKPSKIIATTATIDNNTAWYLDDEMVFVGKKLDLEVKPGTYQLKVDSPFYQVLSTNIKVKLAEETHQQLKLIPIKAQISLASKPDGAAGFVDGELIGKLPVTINRPGGRYKIRIDLDGYESTHDVIVLTNKSQDATRNYQLALKKAYLSFQLQPRTGDLLIDGKQIKNYNKVEITANKNHHILYQKSGYSTYSKDINLSASVEQNLKIILQAELATVVFKSTPLAEVKINGKSLGNTPITTKLLSIPHKIQFNKKNYRTVVKKIHPRANSTTMVNVHLLTEYEANRKQGKATVAQTIGIEMLEFMPGKVTMGSKVNEKGRRRNEFLRNVEFTQPLLVSRNEITESQYSKFHSGSGSGQLPVSNITWLEAVKFCNWLSRKEGLPIFYNIQQGRYLGANIHSNGYRLPTEAEWEWLARKANRVSETIFVWGNSDKIPDKVANLADDSVKSTNVFYFRDYKDNFVGKAPVASFKSDSADLYDLAGNLSEWVHDYYSATPPKNTQVIKDPLGSENGARHFYKGANYNSGRLSELRVAYREPASSKLPTVGFRIVRYK